MGCRGDDGVGLIAVAVGGSGGELFAGDAAPKLTVAASVRVTKYRAGFMMRGQRVSEKFAGCN